jgi:hypothetical protein
MLPPAPALPEEAVEEAAPQLLEELLEQIFLRLPPDEPACLVRASLASKRWLALLTGPRFRRRYREHHAAPPMLGFLNSTPWGPTRKEPEEGHPAVTEPEEERPAVPPFFSTTGVRARVPDDGWGYTDYHAWDCHHGRVLLAEHKSLVEDPRMLAVWDPMTGRRRELQEPEVEYGTHYTFGFSTAAVLCAVSGCDHLACHEGPFRVYHLSLHKAGEAGVNNYHLDNLIAEVRMSSPATCDSSKPFHRAEWSDPCPGISVGPIGTIDPRPPVLLNGALYFMLSHRTHGRVPYAQVLRYDLSSNCLSLIDAPNGGVNMDWVSILMAMEDGSLGFAHLKRFTLFMWSTDVGSDGVAEWTCRRAIRLKKLLPIQNPTKGIRLLGSVEGSDVIFVTTDHGIHNLNVTSLWDKKVSNEEDMPNEDDASSLIPYMSFYNPPGIYLCISFSCDLETPLKYLYIS